MNLSKSTFSFLKALQKNNNRPWFQEHKAEYEAAKDEFTQFAQILLDGLAKIDKTVAPDYPVAKCIFRIYRDVRFSKDKSPYKSFLSAAFSSAGKGTQVPGYYLQFEPGKSFIVAGIWQPSKDKLAAIRQEIDYNSDDFHRIVEHADFKQALALDQDDKLKKAPQGYDIDHPDIAYLRLKSFMAIRHLSDEEVWAPNATEKILETLAAALPFMNFLYQAVEDL